MKFNYLFSAWKKEDQDFQIIRLQKQFIFLLFVLCIFCFIGWMLAPRKLTVYVPPDLSSGATLKQEVIPPAYVYAFGYEVWQLINYWPNDGSTDYPKTLITFAPYLTPQFRQTLQEDLNTLKETGQVQRQRTLQGVAGSAFDSSTVKQLSPTTWEVDLTMRLTEYKNNQPVKDVEILYPLKITRELIAENINPYGLVIAGFVSEPQRLKTYI